MTQKDSAEACPLWRRFLAVFYDTILLFAVLFFATAMLLPFSGGEAIHSGNPFYSFYLLVCGYLYFAWQWAHSGQTLGMRA